MGDDVPELAIERDRRKTQGFSRKRPANERDMTLGRRCPVNVGAQDFLLAKSLLTNRCREVIAFCVRLSLGY